MDEIFVDPSINANSGSGTVGDPFGDLRYAIEQSTFNTTIGTRLNVKAGTAEILTETIDTSMADTSVSVAWVPTRAAPLVIQGYTSAAGDGGIGEIDGNATFAIFASTTLDYIVLRDMKMGNSQNNIIVRLNNFITLLNCEIHTNTNSQVGAVLDTDAIVHQCYFHSTAGGSLTVNGNQFIYGNVFVVTAGTAINNSGADGWVFNNVIKCSGVANGINLSGNSYHFNNSIYSAGGTGKGIRAPFVRNGCIICNNVIEGFSGVGGVGIDLSAGAGNIRILANNSYYDNATDYSAPTNEWLLFGNESLGASPFTDAANNDFTPVDTGQMKEGSWPSFKV